MPMALAVISVVGTVASGVMQYQAQRQQAKTAERVADYNAKLNENQAIQADMEDREEIRRQRAVNARLKGEQRAAVGASGVTTAGSPLEVLGETAGLMELQVQDAARAAESRRRAGFAQASMTRWEGGQLAKGYRRAAAGTLLSTAASAASSGNTLYRAGAFSGGG